ncbi:uncharacterized protein I206_105154 [Kwoniella pini CBS 10737]|uniref:Phytase n=1 Tax=Kwoniella pini CBS 10737 TaxID=1296096 RepID=A0A1B9I553_9TREE|nr:phytase [Kwoniella pini CBS 10737]OCF50611.1 phytase [Kwoniella pini CBS 10737]
MSKFEHHQPGDPLAEEDYELQPTSHSSDPLLPSYDEHKPHFPSPHQRLEMSRRHSRCRGFMTCVCLSLIIVVPSLALVGCYFGRDGLDTVKGWDQLPPDVKEWLDGVLPVGKKTDHGAFPTNIGYAGPTPTGSEAALLATAPALPMYTNVHPLVAPTQNSKNHFNIIQHWGNLSPFYSVASHGLPETNSLIPEQCELEQLHWLQRHGARYPTSYPEGPAAFASRIANARQNWKASGDMKFLNDWNYLLGAEVLTPFGRSQLFNLGVSARIKYGFLLDKMNGRLPVFRTESQDRMLKSAQNFAAGFFGIPTENQYNLEVTIEAPGFNNTMAPWHTCRASEGDFRSKLAEWDAVFLKDAVKRLQGMIQGYEVTIKDAKDMMETCAYETVALGYSSFCDLFTQKEWKGFEYRSDLYWWYSSSFGYAPAAKAQGAGWVQELTSRLTKTRLTEFNSTTNSSFHNDIQFPLNDPLYVDFCHDTQFALLLPTMNLTTFAEGGDLPTDHIPKHRSFIASKIMPFATNLQIQVLSCSGNKNVRLILNDAVVPLTGIKGCPENDEGLCPFDAFVSSMQELTSEVDFAKTCALDTVGQTSDSLSTEKEGQSETEIIVVSPPKGDNEGQEATDDNEDGEGSEEKEFDDEEEIDYDSDDNDD